MGLHRMLRMFDDMMRIRISKVKILKDFPSCLSIPAASPHRGTLICHLYCQGGLKLATFRLPANQCGSDLMLRSRNFNPLHPAGQLDEVTTERVGLSSELRRGRESDTRHTFKRQVQHQRNALPESSEEDYQTHTEAARAFIKRKIRERHCRAPNVNVLATTWRKKQ